MKLTQFHQSSIKLWPILAAAASFFGDMDIFVIFLASPVPGVISRGNAVPIVNMYKNAVERNADALWTTLQTIFQQKMH